MSSRGSLLRVLGITFGIAVVVGGMVGQGILRTPGIIAGAVHSPELILVLWALGAVLAGISAFGYVELATAIPCAGGPYDFVRRAFGPLAGVVTGWGAWLILVKLEVIPWYLMRSRLLDRRHSRVHKPPRAPFAGEVDGRCKRTSEIAGGPCGITLQPKHWERMSGRPVLMKVLEQKGLSCRHHPSNQTTTLAVPAGFSKKCRPTHSG